jgi:hypothetical protein
VDRTDTFYLFEDDIDSTELVLYSSIEDAERARVDPKEKLFKATVTIKVDGEVAH